jgi:hypothetical protein
MSPRCADVHPEYTALTPVGAGSLEGSRLKVVMKADTGRKEVVETGEERGGGDRSRCMSPLARVYTYTTAG